MAGGGGAENALDHALSKGSAGVGCVGARNTKLGGEGGAQGGLGWGQRLEIGGAESGERDQPFLRGDFPRFSRGGTGFEKPAAGDFQPHAKTGEPGERIGAGGGGLLGRRERAEPTGELGLKGARLDGGGVIRGQGGSERGGGGLAGITTITGAALDIGDPGKPGGVGVFAILADRAGTTASPSAASVEKSEAQDGLVFDLSVEVVVGGGANGEHRAGLEQVAPALTCSGRELVEAETERGDRLGRADAAHDGRTGTGSGH